MMEKWLHFAPADVYVSPESSLKKAVRVSCFNLPPAFQLVPTVLPTKKVSVR
jgi:hypothetical protein